MSLQNTSLPALLMFAGAWMFVVVPVDAVVVFEAFLPPPPQPAARATASASKASPGTVEIFWRCMVGPFLRRSWAPRRKEWPLAS